MRCTYCGNSNGNTKDHVIPLIIRHTSAKGNENNSVPCCNRCNVIKNRKHFNSFEEILEYLLTRYRKKAKQNNYNNLDDLDRIEYLRYRLERN